MKSYLYKSWSKHLNTATLKRDEVLEVLRRYKEDFSKRYGVTALGIFGSVARDAAGNESDVDVVVQMQTPNLFFMVHIKDALEEALQRHVDIIHYHDKRNQFLQKRTDKDAYYV